ncbi:fumarylacetoacetate hydrolase family protein [Haloterrigena sp. SYSU A121-1]|uniref:Fumarylacetoacetate hydrolase family protein n=1 Tax=Haloterrigena gelatinilytica TaxID=2741724 RepID=A0A8J8KG79_9EURY|nr:fumarylacetoacetate hydrolase family protein [Haloterrigena gelatinilytica]NUB93118.1 fumarylacetoacetate hydrolase family protein [Haloterrigena gelatinilytica]
MKLARIATDDGPVAGRYEDGVLHADDGAYDVGADPDFLPPCDPAALYRIDGDVAGADEQSAREHVDALDFVAEPAASLVGHRAPVPAPDPADELAADKLVAVGEFAAVIDERCRNVSEDAVPEIVRGYAIRNDVVAVDRSGHPVRNAVDGPVGLGPWIETAVDPTGVGVRFDVTGERRREATTESMPFDPVEIVSSLSRRVSLRSGDVVSLGSPAAPESVEAGDAVETTYEGVGTLRNTVVDSSEPEGRDEREALRA